MQGSLTVYPHLKADKKSGPAKSLNMGKRARDDENIARENERMLNRLQDQGSYYNVYDWELDRKQAVKRVKAICYHPPSMINKKKSVRSTRNRGSRTNYQSENIEEPNRRMYELYQDSIRKSSGMGLIQDSTDLSGHQDMAEISEFDTAQQFHQSSSIAEGTIPLSIGTRLPSV